MRMAVADYYLRNGISALRTQRDLYRAAVALTDETVPSVRVCADHHTPWDYMWTNFFELHRSSLVIACRGGGKTKTTAMLNFLELLFKPKVEIASVGAIDKQAKRGYRYTKSYLDHPLAEPLMKRSVIEMTEMENGATYEQLVGTMNGVNSPHPQKLRADEVELMSREVLNEMMMIPMSKGGIRASLSLISSRKFAAGNMQQLYDDAQDNARMNVLIWCYKEVAMPCPQERRGTARKRYEIADLMEKGEVHNITAWEGCQHCILLPTCRGDLARSRGFVPIEDIEDEFDRLDTETWIAQKECRRPGKRAQVFYEFEEKLNVIDNFVPPVDKGITFRAYDHGGSAPTVCLWMWRNSEGDYFVFDEYYRVNRLIEDHARDITTRYPKHDYKWDFTDPSAAQEAREYDNPGLGEHRIKMTPAYNPIEPGIRVVRGLMKVSPKTKKPRLYICRRCTNTIREVKQLRRKILGGIVTDLIEGNDDHCSDALRYGVATAERKLSGYGGRPSGERPDHERPSGRGEES